MQHKKNAEREQRKATRKLNPPIADTNTASAVAESDETTGSLVDEVFRWTLGGRTSSAHQKLGDAIWERDRVETLSQSSSPTTHIYSAPMPRPTPLESKSGSAREIPSTNGKRKKTVYDELVILDNKLDSRINNIAYTLGTDTPVLSTYTLKDHETWLRNMLQTLRATKPGDDIAAKTLLTVMQERVEDHISKIEARTKILASVELARQPEEFDTGE